MVLECFSTETEAAVARSFLEANSIIAYIFDNDPAHRFSLRIGTNLDFTIRLMVNSSDLNDARKLLTTKKIY